MSYIKINENLFLAKQELNRMIKFLDEDGFRLWMKENSISFGLFNLAIDGNFINGQVSADAGNTFQINELLGLDSDLNFLFKRAQATQQLNGGVVDNNWYWVKYSHQYSPLEDGLVSVDASGNLSGVDTAFLDVLRGQPNYASKIKFYKQDGSAAVNNQEYELVEVVDDTNGTLAGIFTPETDLRYSVVGTFVAGSSPPAGNKEIFQYDNALIEIIQETVANTPPTLVAGKEFVLARIQNATQLVIQDKRTSIYGSKDNYFLTKLDLAQSPCLGVEQVRYDQSLSTRTSNIVQIAWGFRTANWTIDTNLNRVTFNTGVGGKFKSTDDFTDGDFDGWRLYSADGKYSIIKSSIKSGSQINFDLDVLDVDRFSNDGGATLDSQTLVVTPNCETIDLIFEGTIPNAQITEHFPIRKGYAEVYLPVYLDPTCTFTVSSRYRNNADYAPKYLMPDDLVLGYLNENSFNDDGSINVGSEIYQTYSGGIITLQLAAQSYPNIIGSIVTGDLFGYESFDLNNGAPVKNIQVGSNKTNIRINPTAITLTTENYINLKTTGAKAGNYFWFNVQADITVDVQTFQLVQDYVNAGDPGTLLLDMSKAKFTNNAKVKNLTLRCIFDGTNWVIFPIISEGMYERLYLDLTTEGGSFESGYGANFLAGAFKKGDDIIIQLGISRLATPVPTSTLAFNLPPELAAINAGALGIYSFGPADVVYDTGSSLPYRVGINGDGVYFSGIDGSIPPSGANVILQIMYKAAESLLDDYVT